MSLNFCTVNSTSLNGFCGSRRSIVLARLIAEKQAIPTTVYPTQTTLGPNFDIRAALKRSGKEYLYPEFEQDDRKPLDYEQLQITVNVSDFLGLAGSQTIDVSQQQTEFVSVTNLDFVESQIFVNILDLRF